MFVVGFWHPRWKSIKPLNFEFPSNANLLDFINEFQWFQWTSDPKSKGPSTLWLFSKFSCFQDSNFFISRKCKFVSFSLWIWMISIKHRPKTKGSPLWLFPRLSYSARLRLLIHISQSQNVSLSWRIWIRNCRLDVWSSQAQNAARP